MPSLDADDNDFGDFNPRKRRRVGGNSKEKAALGIFGSDSEDDGPGKQWKRKTLRNRSMNFVSTANTAKSSGDQGEADSDDTDDNRPVLGKGAADEDDTGDEDEDEDSPALGLGLGFSGRGSAKSDNIAAPRAAFQNGETMSRPLAKSKFERGNVLGQGFVPSSANEPVLKESHNGGPPPPSQNKPQPSAFSAKANGKINAKSFGARMMAKMGYVEGQGLGKEGQGRNVIIEANLRPQGIGLGAVKEKTEQERREEKRQAELRGEVVVDSDEEEKKRKRKAKAKKTLGGNHDSGSSTPQRSRTKYLTAEELKASAPGLHIPDAFTPILDMTGPGGKMITSTSGIMTPTSGVPDSTEVIEARKLAKRAQADLGAFLEEWKHLQERDSYLGLELKESEQEVEELRSDFERLSTFSSLVSNELLSVTEWDQVIGCLQKATELMSMSNELTDIAVAAIHPHLRDAMWDPLKEPSRFASDLRSIPALTAQPVNGGKAVGKWDSLTDHQNGVYRKHHKATTTYETMMYRVWLPRVLGAMRTWDPLDPTPMISIMEAWNDLLPAFVRAQFIDNVVRKLEAALSDWNPKKQRRSYQSPHTWLFPWLPYLPAYHLDAKGTGLVADVKRKFRQVIDLWEFERGLVPGLEKWQEILGQDQWQRLVMSHVLPAMGKYMRTHFRVEPADQAPYLPVLTGVLGWTSLLGSAMITEVLLQGVFPMWYAKLEEWLALDQVDLEEVAAWYEWWRGVVLADYAGVKRINSELDKGLRAMNSAV
jgi:tuftelin-interacting protein 11